MPILSTADFPQVRAAIDPLLGEDELPDDVIALPVYRGAAEADVLRRLPNAATFLGEDGDRVRYAVIYLTAALLAPALPDVTSVQLGQSRYQQEPRDTWKRVGYLQGMAARQLASLIDPFGGDGHPKLFGLVPGTRG